MKTSMTQFGLALAIFGLTAGSAWASSITVPNFSFETPPSTTTATPTSWTTIGSALSYNPYEFGGGNFWYTGANPTTDPANSGSGFPGINGSMLGYGYGGSGNGFQQTLAATLQPFTTYTLTIAEGTRNLGAGTSLGSLIQLLAGSTVIASSSDTVGPTAGTIRDQTATLTDSSAFSALYGQSLSIRMTTTNFSGGGSYPATDWDNVRLTAGSSVPEIDPGSAAGALALLGMGGALVNGRRRKRTA